MNLDGEPPVFALFPARHFRAESHLEVPKPAPPQCESAPGRGFDIANRYIFRGRLAWPTSSTNVTAIGFGEHGCVSSNAHKAFAKRPPVLRMADFPPFK